MIDPRWAIFRHLGHAAACYGDDLPLRLPAVEPLPERVCATIDAGAPEPDRATTEGVAATLAPPAARSPELALAELRTQVMPCTMCKLAASRTHLVFGEGRPTHG
ncbi:MAG: hypothetical protein H6837_13240 [Planctomycetes bacterium]|nr:hypothetical protein [Planctomycetota bacterium]